MIRYSFSKTQEHEAALHAWQWLRHSPCDPRAVGGSFSALMRWKEEIGSSGYQPGLLRDYFASHPPLEVRVYEFSNRTDRWWRQHENERRYAGAQNLTKRKALDSGSGQLPDGWVTGVCPLARRYFSASRQPVGIGRDRLAALWREHHP